MRAINDNEAKKSLNGKIVHARVIMCYLTTRMALPLKFRIWKILRMTRVLIEHKAARIDKTMTAISRWPSTIKHVNINELN